MKELLDVLKEGEQLGDNVGSRATAIAKFEEKYTAFVNLICNTHGHSTAKRAYLMKEAETTSDFPTLFGTVLERTIRAKYNLVVPDFEKYIKMGTQNDFRMAWDMALYGNRLVLPQVKERGDYQSPSALGDGKFVIGLKKYGRTFGLSWEDVINDDLGAFNDVADDLVLSAKNTVAKFATGLFAGASGPLAFSGPSGAQGSQSGLFAVAGTHPIDGTSFTNYSTSGSNPLSAGQALSASGVAQVITALKSQKDYDGNPILFNRFILVVPVGKEFTGLQILSNNLLIATALTSNSFSGGPNQQVGQTSENILAKYPLTLAVNPWLDIISGSTYGPFSWYVFGEPSDGDAIRLNYLRGHEAPEICQKMSDKITLGGAPISPLEGDFDSDTIQWRIRHVFGGTSTDPRFAYGVQATS